MSEPQEESKIVVDEDWKSRVQAEKAAAEAGKQDEQPSRPPDQEKKSGRQQHATGPLPPPSFPYLVSSLAAQAITAMGRLPDPVEGHPVVRPDLAKHYVDLLGMLEEKTKGNLTPEESEMLGDVLHELRMAFVMTRREPAAPG